MKELAQKQAQIYYLTERGTTLESTDFDVSKPIVFALGDDRGLPTDHKEILSQHAIQEVRVGKQSLLGSHVVTLVLLELARRVDQKHH